MVAKPLIEVRCAVCSGEGQELICSAREVEAHLKYLRAFHQRRLRGARGEGADGLLADRADFTQEYATDIVACRDCGLVYRTPRPTDRAITRAYEGDSYGAERLASLFEAQRDLYRAKVRHLRRWLPRDRPARVVEVGSFVGGFLAVGREQGWEMLGVDPGEQVGDFCRSMQLPVFRGSLPEAPLEAASVDAITIWNTFDQLPEPESTLVAVRRALRPGGLLVLRVPNGACFRALAAWNRRLPRPLGGWLRAAMAWNNLLAFPYLYGYSVRTLDWLLAWHGLERVAVDPDVLPRLSDGETRAWAAWEEAAIKRSWRAAVRLSLALTSRAATLVPWFDAYYRLPAFAHPPCGSAACFRGLAT
jgi:SAM-dependent methyltransferase